MLLSVDMCFFFLYERHYLCRRSQGFDENQNQIPFQPDQAAIVLLWRQGAGGRSAVLSHPGHAALHDVHAAHDRRHEALLPVCAV